MDANPDDLTALLSLQQVDLSLIQAKKKFDGLPQRKQILEIRQKKEELSGKAQKVLALRKDAEKKVSRIIDEDERLATKIADIQKAIDAAGGDYRNLESRTKEMEGQSRRRQELVEKLEAANADLEKILATEKQIAEYARAFDKRENDFIESFKKEGTELQSQMARLAAERKEAAADVDPELIALYEKKRRDCAGVAIGVLSDGRCGVCRVTIEPSRMVDLRAQAPLGTCPHCKRLLIVP